MTGYKHTCMSISNMLESKKKFNMNRVTWSFRQTPQSRSCSHISPSRYKSTVLKCTEMYQLMYEYNDISNYCEKHIFVSFSVPKPELESEIYYLITVPCNNLHVQRTCLPLLLRTFGNLLISPSG